MARNTPIGGITELRGASVVPPAPREVSPHGLSGVFDRDGRFCHAANISRNNAFLLMPGELPEQPSGDLPGRHLFAGQLNHHFGHFLCESLARLWPLRDPEHGWDSVLFISRRAQASTELQAFQTEIFSLLGVDIPIRVLDKPTRVEMLGVPSQGFGTGELSTGTPAFRDYIRTSFARDIRPEGPERLFISRAGLSVRKGAMIGEDILSRRLEAEGYDSFYPEREDIATQVARYKAARRVVAGEGSALHLFGFVGRPDQKVAVIARRSDLFALRDIERQIVSFCGSGPLLVDAVRREWDTVPGSVRSSKSLSEIDMERVRERLHSAGFTSRRRWRIRKVDAQTRVDRIGQRSGRNYTLVFERKSDFSRTDDR